MVVAVYRMNRTCDNMIQYVWYGIAWYHGMVNLYQDDFCIYFCKVVVIITSSLVGLVADPAWHVSRRH